MKPWLQAFLLGTTLAAFPFGLHAGEIAVQNGQKIGFLGDSITEQGSGPSGYVHLVIIGLKAEGIETTAIPAGRSGQAAGAIRSRVGSVLDKGANWITINSGANDLRMVREGKEGGSLESYSQNMAAMVELAKSRGVNVILLTTTHSPKNTEIAPYNEFLRKYAKENNILLADVNQAFRDVLLSPPPPGWVGENDSRLLADGVHPNQAGQTLIARVVLLALGVPPEDMPKVEKEWMENPHGKGVKLGNTDGANDYVYLTRNQFDAVERIAKTQRKEARGIIKEMWKQALDSAPKDTSDPAAYAQSQIDAMVNKYIADHQAAAAQPK
jgi:lysophospholipase L1-like esterase